MTFRPSPLVDAHASPPSASTEESKGISWQQAGRTAQIAPSLPGKGCGSPGVDAWGDGPLGARPSRPLFYACTPSPFRAHRFPHLCLRVRIPAVSACTFRCKSSTALNEARSASKVRGRTCKHPWSPRHYAVEPATASHTLRWLAPRPRLLNKVHPERRSPPRAPH